jgi:hypothetical protein
MRAKKIRRCAAFLMPTAFGLGAYAFVIIESGNMRVVFKPYSIYMRLWCF